jgi:hypothetical protein
MKKNLLNEINEMKRLFGHKRGVVISEQPEIMEPDTDTETKPRTRPGKPDTDPFPNPFNPDRAKEFNPLPDLEPQGEYDDVVDFDMNEPDVMEPDTETETKPRTRPGRPDSDPFPNPFNPDRAKEFNPLPDLEPQGRMGDDENEPFINDVDTDYSESRSLEDLVAKYLNRRQNNN